MSVSSANKSEVFYEINTNTLIGNNAVYYLFPPTGLYNNNGEILEEYRHTPDDRIVNKDIAFLKLSTFKDPGQDSSYNDGEFDKTNVAGAFYAVGADDYFFKYTGLDSTISPPTLDRGANIPKIGEVIKLPSSSEGGTFETSSLGMISTNVNRFDDLEVDGLNEGERPLGQQMIAARLEDEDMEDVTYRLFDEALLADPKAFPSIGGANTITNEVKAQTGRSTWPGIDADLLVEAENEYINEKGVFTEETDYVSGVEIVNVERDLDDLRYGDEEDRLPLIFTGAIHVFTDAELTAVESKVSLPIDIDVWGGDSYIGLHTFKVSDSAYVLTDPEKKADGSGTAGSPAVQAAKWGTYFDKNSSEGLSGAEDVSRPFPVKGTSQTITVLLESEINPEVAEKNQHKEYTDALPVPRVDTAGQIRAKFDYRYNLDYTRQNDYKVFFPFRTFEKNNTLFGSRIAYSDSKIYQSDVEGFDRFRVLSFYDVDETHGDIKKLQLASDNLYSLQESAVAYIPINAQAVELSTGANLEVRSGDIIGIPIFIDTTFGTQHPATVKVDGSSIFFVDSFNKEAMKLSGKTLQSISKLGVDSYFNSMLPVTTPGYLTAIYDKNKLEYIVSNRNNEIIVYSDLLGVWTSEWIANNNWTLLNGLTVDDQLYVIGMKNAGGVISAESDVKLATMYTASEIANYFGLATSPSAKFFVTPDIDLPKTFDNVILNASGQIDGNFNMSIPVAGTSDKTTSVAVPSSPVEGTYRIKVLRDSGGARMRGLHAEYEFGWGQGELSPVSLTSVITKYRPSYRPI